MTPTIKVQLIGKVTIKSAILSGIQETNHPLTFHAYSDTMKARIFEALLKTENKGKIAISITDETPRDGEWHEPLVKDCLINNFKDSDENISLALEYFSNQYPLKDVLSNPQDFLGPYSEQVFEFWERLDQLTDEQWKKIESRFKEIEDTSYIVKTILQMVDTLNFKYDGHSLTICHELYGSLFTAVYACYVSTGYSLPSAVATFEIIKGLDDKIALKMFDDL